VFGKTEPVSLELKEGAKPYHGEAYPVPQSHKETTIKELNRLCGLGVLEFQPDLEWVSPSFITPKKTELYAFSLILESSINKSLESNSPFPKSVQFCRR
jgi:hypothetical protein